MEVMTPQSRQWYIARDGQEYGPISDAELANLHELGHVLATDLLWREGLPNWRSVLVLFPTWRLVVQQAAIKDQSRSRVGSAIDRAGYVAAKQVTTWRPALAKSLVALLCVMAIVAVYTHYPSLMEIIRPQ
jgi:hypothetical protein